jgi:glycosyltransferase involved in cell wall biosynthesis
LRVLQICHSYYAPFLDCARQYAALFKDTQYKVLTVYLTGDANEQVAADTACDEVIFLGYKSAQVSGLKLNAISKIRKIVAKENFAFCIAHRAKPTYVALLATKLPVISIHHNYNDFGRMSRRLMVNIFKSRLLLLGVSDSVRDDMRRQLKSWPQEKIQTLYNHIDVEVMQSSLLNRVEARRFLNISDNAWVFSNVGRLHHDKDQANLIRGFHLAAPNLPVNSILMIIGSGPLETSLKALVKKLHLEDKVIFTGKVLDAKEYFKAFDVFVLTSDHEPFGMVLLEAMAAGLPLICSDCGGGAEVVKNVGALFKQGDDESLSKALIEMCRQDQTNLNVRLNDELNERFSDEAVKSIFWDFSFVNDSITAAQQN